MSEEDTTTASADVTADGNTTTAKTYSADEMERIIAQRVTRRSLMDT